MLRDVLKGLGWSFGEGGEGVECCGAAHSRGVVGM
jgi:hypothetical protein